MFKSVMENIQFSRILWWKESSKEQYLKSWCKRLHLIDLMHVGDGKKKIFI